MSRPSKESRAARLLSLLFHQNGLCWICGQPMQFPQWEPGKRRSITAYEATIDHIERKRKPGDFSPRPIKAAHSICNTRRNHKPVGHPNLSEHIYRMKLHFYIHRRN